jgi:hypothetical protein
MCNCIEELAQKEKERLGAVRIERDKSFIMGGTFNYRLKRKNGTVSSITKHDFVFYTHCPFCGKKFPEFKSKNGNFNTTVATICTPTYSSGSNLWSNLLGLFERKSKIKFENKEK